MGLVEGTLGCGVGIQKIGNRETGADILLARCLDRSISLEFGLPSILFHINAEGSQGGGHEVGGQCIWVLDLR